MRISTITCGLAALLPLALAGAAPKVANQPTGTQYVATLPNTKSTTGDILIGPGPGGNGASIQISISGLPTEGGPFLYHIHEKSIDSTGNCSTAGGHLDPYGNSGTGCNTSDPASCEVGDLSGKHGKIQDITFSANYVDDYVSVKPGEKASVVDRSIVVHFANKTAITCANLTLKGAASGNGESNGASSNGGASSSGQGSGSGSGSGSNGAGNGGAASGNPGGSSGSGSAPGSGNGSGSGNTGAGSGNAPQNGGGSQGTGSGNGGSAAQGGAGNGATTTQTVISTMPAGDVKTVTVTTVVPAPTTSAVPPRPTTASWLVNTITEVVTVNGSLTQTATQVVSNASTIVIIGTQAATTTSSRWTTLTSTKTD